MHVVNGINLTGVQALIMAKAEQAANLGAQHILTESRKLAPHEEGILEQDGKVTTEKQGDKAVAAISYSLVYAARQHEETTWRHDDGRQAKYLEQPLHTEADTVANIVAAQVRLE